MKLILFTLAVVLIATSLVQGQTLTACSQTQSWLNGSDQKVRFHFCQESKVGFGIIAVGIVTGVVGITQFNANSGGGSSDVRTRKQNIGAGAWLVGGVVAIMGSIFAIDGRIQDLHRFYRQRKLSVISLHTNELGLAYNF